MVQRSSGFEHRFKLALVARVTVEPVIVLMTDKFKLQSLAAATQCCLPLKRVGKTYGFCRVTEYPVTLVLSSAKRCLVAGEADVGCDSGAWSCKLSCGSSHRPCECLQQSGICSRVLQICARCSSVCGTARGRMSFSTNVSFGQ